jgi:two-component system phosphate regulon sensor histidine kinase PhoR
MGGTGLGLAIVKHIINRHRGYLDITSVPGGETVFSVALPLVVTD